LAPGPEADHVLDIHRADSPVAWLSANNTCSGQNNFNNAAGTFTGTFSGNGSGVTSLNANNLSSGTVPPAALSNAWKTTGNAGTTPGTHFLGTTDNQPLELKVNNLRALRLEPGIEDANHSGAPNVIGG